MELRYFENKIYFNHFQMELKNVLKDAIVHLFQNLKKFLSNMVITKFDDFQNVVCTF